MLKTFTGSPSSLLSPPEWCRCWISWNQRAKALSASVMPGVTAEATISSTLRKLLRPLESHGLTTSVSPTFSIRTERLDSQVWTKAPSRAIPQPIGNRQFRPSIVPPWTTVYWCVPPAGPAISSTCDLATSVGCLSIDQGYNAASATTGSWRAGKFLKSCSSGKENQPGHGCSQDHRSPLKNRLQW